MQRRNVTIRLIKFSSSSCLLRANMSTGMKIFKVICIVCFKIRGKSVVLAAKTNNLWKYKGRKNNHGTMLRCCGGGEIHEP